MKLPPLDLRSDLAARAGTLWHVVLDLRAIRHQAAAGRRSATGGLPGVNASGLPAEPAGNEGSREFAFRRRGRVHRGPLWADALHQE